VNAPPAFGRSGCPWGRDPKTKRYEYATAKVRGGRRAAQREAARLVKLASEGRISTAREALGGLLGPLARSHRARGRAPKTLFENRRLATAISAELGEKELRKVTGRDLDSFYDRRVYSPASVNHSLPPLDGIVVAPDFPAMLGQTAKSMRIVRPISEAISPRPSR
jgi:hypothetical protein